MTLALSTQGIAGASGFPHDPELIGSTDQTVTYAGVTAMRAVLPKVRDGSSDTVDDGWALSVFVTGAGSLELVDIFGHRVLLVPGYGQAALVANDDTHFDGTYGGWTPGYVWPNVQVEDTTYQLLTYGSVASDATPSVLHAKEIDVQSSVAITYLDEGVLGQRVIVKLSCGTNTTVMTVVDAASFILDQGRDFIMATGDALELQMVSTDAWQEISRSVTSPVFISVTSASVINADDGNLFNVSSLASNITSIANGQIGQIISLFTSVVTGGLTHSTGLALSSAANFTFGADETVQLIKYAAGAWAQLDAQADS